MLNVFVLVLKLQNAQVPQPQSSAESGPHKGLARVLALGVTTSMGVSEGDMETNGVGKGLAVRLCEVESEGVRVPLTEEEAEREVDLEALGPGVRLLRPRVRDVEGDGETEGEGLVLGISVHMVRLMYGSAAN